jgi:hypothetical protein
MAGLSLPRALKVPSHLLKPSQGPFADTEFTDMVNRALNSTLHRERWKYSKSEAVLQCLDVAATQPTIIGAEQDGVQVTKSPASPITFGFDLQFRMKPLV